MKIELKKVGALLLASFMLFVSCEKHNVAPDNTTEEPTSEYRAPRDYSEMMNRIDLSDVTDTRDSYNRVNEWMANEDVNLEFYINPLEIMDVQTANSNEERKNYIIEHGHFSTAQNEAVLNFLNSYEEPDFDFYTSLETLSSELNAVEAVSEEEAIRAELLVETLLVLDEVDIVSNPIHIDVTGVDPCAAGGVLLAVSFAALCVCTGGMGCAAAGLALWCASAVLHDMGC